MGMMGGLDDLSTRSAGRQNAQNENNPTSLHSLPDSPFSGPCQEFFQLLPGKIPHTGNSGVIGTDISAGIRGHGIYPQPPYLK
jgi:hypothetical protein